MDPDPPGGFTLVGTHGSSHGGLTVHS
jgi:hypothetical protein